MSRMILGVLKGRLRFEVSQSEGMELPHSAILISMGRMLPIHLAPVAFIILFSKFGFGIDRWGYAPYATGLSLIVVWTTGC